MLWSRRRLVVALASPAFAGLVGLTQSAAQEQEPKASAKPSAKQVLARSIKTYAEARSYEDEGEVVLVFVSPTGRRTVKRPFSTRFVRPKLFRYEFSDRFGDGEGEWNRFVIWSDAAPERAKQWWTIQPETKEDSLMLAIAGGTGISGGSATTVPGLLMPDVIKGESLSLLQGLKILGEEEVEGSSCIKIEGKTPWSGAETVWIDKESSLLKKMYSTTKIPNATVEQTTTYRPRVNVEITPEKFEFTPPKS